MGNNLQVIGNTLRSAETQGKLMLALGVNNPKSTEAKNEAKKYCASVLAEVEKSAGSKNDLTTCNPDSIVKCMIDAAQFRLMIDGRQHAHLIKYGNAVSLQIGYRGYLAKIAEHYEDADINVFPVYKGDTLEISGKGGFDDYEYKRANNFPSDNDFEGVCAALYYKKGGREFQKVITMSASEIQKIRNVAKQDFIWKAWFIEKAKAAAIKRLCKVQFSSMTLIQDMINYDNKEGFDMDKQNMNSGSRSILDNLNEGIDKVLPKKDEQPTSDDQPDDEDIIEGEIINDDGSMVI